MRGLLREGLVRLEGPPMSLFQLRSTFRLRNPQTRSLHHLWVVVVKIGSDVVAVNLTSYRPGSDTSCLLQVGHHPFIAHPTVVFYEGMVRISAAKQAMILADPGIYIEHEPVSKELLALILAGARRSSRTPRELKQILCDVSG
jgi:hypothetical protein